MKRSILVRLFFVLCLGGIASYSVFFNGAVIFLRGEDNNNFAGAEEKNTLTWQL